MKRSWSFLSSLVILATVGVQPLFAEVHFKDISFAEAKKLAIKQKKKIMVDFYTDWCSWCKVLDRKTYSDMEVGKFADAKFISVKINAEKGDGIALAKASKVSGYPTIVFFGGDGKEVDRVVGYQDAPKFMRSMRLVNEGGIKSILAAVTKTPASTDPGQWLTAANYYSQNKQPKEAVSAYRKVIGLDGENKKKLAEEAAYGLAFASEGEDQWHLLEEATMRYPDRDENRTATEMLIKHDMDSKHDEEAIRRMDMYALHHDADGDMFNSFAWMAAEKGVLLDRAMIYAERAVGLAHDPQMRAQVLDTKAEIAYKMGRFNEAIAVEQEAMSLLNPDTDTRLLKDLSAQKVKFDQAASLNNGNAPNDVVVPNGAPPVQPQ